MQGYVKNLSKGRNLTTNKDYLNIQETGYFEKYVNKNRNSKEIIRSNSY